jgi:hypothetical protein
MASVAAPGPLRPPSPGRGRRPRPSAAPAPGDGQVLLAEARAARAAQLTPGRAGDSAQEEAAEQLEVINEEDLPVKV